MNLLLIFGVSVPAVHCSYSTFQTHSHVLFHCWGKKGFTFFRGCVNLLSSNINYFCNQNNFLKCRFVNVKQVFNFFVLFEPCDIREVVCEYFGSYQAHDSPTETHLSLMVSLHLDQSHSIAFSFTDVPVHRIIIFILRQELHTMESSCSSS